MAQNNSLYDELIQDLQTFYEKYPEQYHPFLTAEHEQLMSSCSELYKIEQLTQALFTEITSCRIGYNKDGDIPRKYYEYVCEQIYCFFSAKGYGAEVYTAVALKEMLITTTAVELAQLTGWNTAFVTAAVTLVVSTAVKVGIRSWCRYYEDSHPDMKADKL